MPTALIWSGHSWLEGSCPLFHPMKTSTKHLSRWLPNSTKLNFQMRVLNYTFSTISAPKQITSYFFLLFSLSSGCGCNKMSVVNHCPYIDSGKVGTYEDYPSDKYCLKLNPQSSRVVHIYNSPVSGLLGVKFQQEPLTLLNSLYTSTEPFWGNAHLPHPPGC